MKRKGTELKTKMIVDADTIRRFHSMAKELVQLADSIGRHERVDFAEVWPETMGDKDARNKQLPLFLGLTSTDEKLVVDLASLPNLLVGGATGQGKSNLLNSIICGLTRLLSPDELRLVLVDTKMVEFTPYAALPHLAFQTITDGNKCVSVLRWLADEESRRLKALAFAECQNIAEYREKGNAMPSIVVVIDEFADLMFSHGKEFETAVSQLFSYGRATGIHLVMATQRADHNVLTVSLRCCFPCRISFRTRNLSESNLILDSPDADVLCAPGDMLVRQKDGSLVRAQCAFLSAIDSGTITEDIMKWYPHAAYLASISDSMLPVSVSTSTTG